MQRSFERQGFQSAPLGTQAGARYTSAMVVPRRCWFLLFFFLSLQATAETENIQVAYELEIDEIFAAALAPYFDLDGDGRKAEYLMKDLPKEAPTLEARHVAELPEAVRAKTLQNYTLQDLNAPAKPSPSGLIGLGGAPLKSTSPLDTVNRRWAELWRSASLEERAAWVPARALSRSAQASLLMKMLQDRNAFTKSLPALRPQIKDTELANVFEGLRWHRDGAQLEFTDLGTSSNLMGTLARWKRLASLANVSRAFDEAKDTAAGAGYHLNISVHGPLERDLTEFAHLYQNRFLVDAVANGKGEKLFRLNNLVGYQPNVRTRGIVRLKDTSFLEVRAHFKSAEEELRELKELLQMPAEEAHAVLARETNAQLTPEIVRSLGGSSPLALYHVVSSIERSLPPGEPKFTLASPEVRSALITSGKPSVDRVLDLIEVGNAARTKGESPTFLREIAKILGPAVDSEVIAALLVDSRPIPEVVEMLRGVLKRDWNKAVGSVALQEFSQRPVGSRLPQLFALAKKNPEFEKEFKDYLLSERSENIRKSENFSWRDHLPFFSLWMKSAEVQGDSALRQKLADCILGLRMKLSDKWVASQLYATLEGTDREAIASRLRVESKIPGPTRRLLLDEFATGTLPPSLIAYVSNHLDDWDSDRESLIAGYRSKPAHQKLLQEKLYGRPSSPSSLPCNTLYPRLAEATRE